MSGRRSFARRFIAGETVEDAIAAVRRLEAQRLHHTLDHLGESVTTLEGTEACTREYLSLIEDVASAGIERNISLKLTQLGLDVDRAICVDNLRRILAAGDRHEFFVRIDMESSQYTEATLSIFETVWRHGNQRVGVVLQSCLYRTEKDFERVNALGARVRLVKGAYREPKAVAFQRKADVDAAYVTLAKRLLVEGTYPAIATHDEAIIDEVKRFAAAHAIAPIDTNFRCSTGSAATCRPRSWRRVIACACMCRSARSGSRISCAASASAPPTWASSSARSCQRNKFSPQRTQRKSRGIFFLKSQRFLRSYSASSVVKGSYTCGSRVSAVGP